MLDHFDFSILESDEFKEDAVREEVIYPILRALGYSASGQQKIVRSKTLTHPFVHIGSTKRKINIIPDYTLFFEDTPIMILDAKRPGEKVTNSGNVEQVFSYAIHPDIRCDHYALCNGKQLSVYHVSKTSPVAIIDIESNKENTKEFEKYLSPEYLLMPEKRDFMKDFGLYSKKIGISNDTTLIFVGYYVQLLTKVESNLYSAVTVNYDGNENFLVSFDFDESVYQQLKGLLPTEVANSIEHYLTKQPFRCDLNCKLMVNCAGTLGSLQSSELTGEEFVPIILDEIIAAQFNPDDSCNEIE